MLQLQFILDGVQNAINMISPRIFISIVELLIDLLIPAENSQNYYILSLQIFALKGAIKLSLRGFVFFKKKGDIVDFLLGDGPCIAEFETVEVDEFVCIIVLINLVEYLPCDIIINLLLHLLILFICYLVLRRFVSVSLIFFVHFLVELVSYLFEFLMD